MIEDVDAGDIPTPVNSGRLFEPPRFDDPKYREPLEGMDLTEEEMTDILRALHSILCTLIDISFGVDSVQRVLPALAEFSSHEESNEVKLSNNTQQFNNAAGNKAEKDDES